MEKKKEHYESIYTRVEHLGIALLQGRKISADDIKFISRYYRKNEGSTFATQQDLVNADPRSLTRGQKAYRTRLLSYGFERV